MNQRTPYHLSGPSGEWAVTIGLEVHAQIASHAKLFSGAATHFGAEPNTQVAFLDAGMPGQLPVINSVCIDQAIRVGLGLNAEIHLYSRFDRKNYFYPDLPQGYQISQFALPIVGQGAIEIDGSDGTRFKIRIERLHLEQDAGKSIHDLDPSASYVDLNRSGVALMEIVSFPDMQSPDEAADYVRSLRAILMALKACHGDMEKGHLRADVNVSVRRLGDDTLGTRCEIKNVNSFRFIRESIEFEARRQVDLLEDGGTIEQETRLFDPTSGRTRTMRSKEDAHDYRYFPDPDLPPLRLKPERVERIRATLPELPAQKRARFMHEYGLSEYDARVLTDDLDRAEFFEHVAKGRDSRLAANWVSQELSAVLNRDDTPITDSPIKAQQLGRLIDLISAGTISGAIAKRVFALMLEETGADPEQLVEREGLKQMTDTSAIEALVDKIIAQNPEQAAQIEQQKADGHAKPKALGWFVGQVMKASGGKANPPAVNSVLKNRFGL